MSDDTFAHGEPYQLTGLHGIENPALLQARVLVVEPLADQAYLLESVLTSAGYRYVELAGNADEASRRHALHPFDVMLLDIHGQRGRMAETVIRLRRTMLQFAPLIAIIKDTDRDQVGMLVDAGIQDFVTMPVDGIVLRMRMRNALEMKQLRLNSLHRRTSAEPRDECD